MQGKRSSFSALPENISFEHGSVSTDPGVDPQLSWNSMQTSRQTLLPDYRREGPNADWSLGESSSSASQRGQRYGPPDVLSLDNVDVNPSSNLPNSGAAVLPQDLNMSLEFGGQVNDDCQVIEQARSAGSSSIPFSGYVMDDRPDCSLNGRRMSCKRKAVEGHTGQSSGVGSSNCFRSTERSTSMPMPIDDDLLVNYRSEQANLRHRLDFGGAVSADPFSLTAPGNVIVPHRNFHMCVNGVHQEDPTAVNPFIVEGNRDAEVQPFGQPPGLVLRNHVFELNPSPVNLHRHPVLLPVPSARRNHLSRWSGVPSTRATSSSVPAIPEDPTLRHIPRGISEHPMFVPANEMGNASQVPVNWNSTGLNPVTGNVASAPRVGPSTRAGSSSPGWSRRSCPQYPPRLSEFVRRSLLSSTESGGPSGNHAAQLNSSVASQEMAFPSGLDNHRRRAPSSRAGSFGIPYSLRTLSASSEGRSGIMSEQIRRVLDLMQRGEGLRLEDVMILDHPVLFGMADIHDRHRDMRMDVDNMSYEELLALEERIGSVCTGLTEESIKSRLKQQKFPNTRPSDEVETEPCSICREEYNGGEDIGILECGHDFHTGCIEQWLMVKNLCPICKAMGLTT